MNQFSWADPPSHTAFPVASAGYSYIFSAAFVTAVFALLELTVLALIGLVVTFFICYFFRNPDRVIPNEAGAVVSPADGKIISVGSVNKHPFADDACVKISIFMSVFNVHVNRIPYDGRVREIRYLPGRFFPADLDKAWRHNEQNAVLLEIESGKTICVVQIAGLIARRIICRLQEGDTLSRGQRFGMICFGSRLDVYLPSDARPIVTVGNHVQAGTSILGYVK